MRKAMGEAGDRLRKLEREYPWIQSEKVHFGRQGSDYDWQANDPDKARAGRGGRGCVCTPQGLSVRGAINLLHALLQMFEEYERANSTIELLAKKVNKRVNAMFEKAEQEYNELKRKKDVVEGDKRRIQEVRMCL